MERLGIHWGFLIAQLCVGVGWLTFTVVSLFNLRSKKLTGMALALWVLIICAIPFLGSLAYWIVRPSAENQ